MISSPPVPTGQGNLRPVLAWPQSLVHHNDGSVCGFVMSVAESTWSINKLFFPEQRAKLRTSTNTEIGWHHLHVIARNLARVVSACHDSGYVIGDLNNNNIRVYSDGQVCLIDTDSFQVVDNSRNPPVVHHSEVVFLDYAAPELLGKDLTKFDRTPACDCYALATLIFMLLQDGLHPFAARTSTDPPLDPSQLMQAGHFPYSTARSDPSVKPYPMAPTFGRLHPRLRELFDRTFTVGLDDPLRRPSADQWQRSLGMARSDLRKCARGHYFVGQPNARCLQVVAVNVGGYCGSTEQSRSLTPIPFKDIDVISGKAISAGASTSGPAPPIDPSAPPSPPRPIPPPPPTLQKNSGSGGSRMRTYAVSAIVVVLLVLALARQFNGESPGRSTVVASGLQSPTVIPKKRTPVPSKVPSAVPTQLHDFATRTSDEGVPSKFPSAVPTQSPKREATKVPSPIPKTPSGGTSKNGPSARDTPTTSLPQPETGTLQEILSQVRRSNSLFYSSQTADGWDLTLSVPANSTEFALLENGPTNPAPALSHDGDLLAYLAKEQPGYVVHVLDLRSGNSVSLPLPVRIGSPSNLAWQSSNASLLVTSTPVAEPRIYRLDVASGDITEFLPPWSANPSVSLSGEMVYVVPSGNDTSNLNIVYANEQGDASLFVTEGSSNENYPSLSGSGSLVAYTISRATEQTHTLGIASRSENGDFLPLPAVGVPSSSSPIQTNWIDADNLVAGLCNDGSCQIVEYSLAGTFRQIEFVSDADAIGNVIMRSP